MFHHFQPCPHWSPRSTCKIHFTLCIFDLSTTCRLVKLSQTQTALTLDFSFCPQTAAEVELSPCVVFDHWTFRIFSSSYFKSPSSLQVLLILPFFPFFATLAHVLTSKSLRIALGSALAFVRMLETTHNIDRVKFHARVAAEDIQFEGNKSEKHAK